MARFNQTLRPTPFGIFDANTEFQTEADNMVTFVLRKLGESTLSVELTTKDIFCCFEEATLEFSAMMLEYQAKSNLSSLLGTPTGSINLTNVYVKQNLEFLERQAEPYIGLIGLGGDQDSISGSITLESGRQDYDLYTELKREDGTPIYDLQPSGSQTKMKIFEIFHEAPIQYIFNSNLAANMAATGAPLETYVPDTRFHVLPLFEDVLRAGMLEAAQRVRRSHYSYRISGRKIRIFPTPTEVNTYNRKLWIRVGFAQAAAPGIIEPVGSGSLYSADNKLYGVSTPSNIPYGVVPYSSLNQWARQWIRSFCLALCKELLSHVRGKFANLPIPGADVQLNAEVLASQGREDKEKLRTELRELLDSLTYEKLAELEANKAEALQKQLQYTSVPANVAIRMG